MFMKIQWTLQISSIFYSNNKIHVIKIDFVFFWYFFERFVDNPL